MGIGKAVERLMTNPCFVYFIQAGQGGNIKIGISRNVMSRFSKMNTDAGEPIRTLLIIPGDESNERALHKELCAHRSHGEWFKPHGDVLAIIDRERAQAGNVEYLIPKPKKVGRNKIHNWRLARGLTGEAAAKLFGIHRTMLCHMELGERLPGWETMRAIYLATDGQITPDDFADFMHEKKESVA